ncbi:MAG: glycosyltransferase family 4 protein [Chlorobium phaeobacteroides]|jgi:glycosyltransferase involved in cell wall biosynthesis|nr:glycosyltransferase family 4 protein [Chlorobium phaeobacteroides]
MKIVYIARSAIPSRDANSIHVMKMCQAFADNGHEVIFLLPDRSSGCEPGISDIYAYYGVKRNFQIRKFEYQHLKVKFVSQIRQMQKSLHELDPDLVYGRCFLGCTIACLSGYKTIYESHLPLWRSGNIKKLWFSLVTRNRNFKRLVVISEALKTLYSNENIISQDKLFVAHDGADKVIDFQSKAELSGEKERLHVGYSGHLYQGKGVEVIAGVAPLMTEVNFHIIGGKENDIAYWKSVIKSDNVFFYGFKNQTELPKYLNSFDICLLPNQKVVLPCGKRDEKRNISDFTSPLKMFEYMAHKKAIISSDLPVLREVLNESNALLVQCDDFQQWADAITALQDKNKREAIAQQAYEDFMTSYTWKIRAEQVLSNVTG